jgi:hypothetical protein
VSGIINGFSEIEIFQIHLLAINFILWLSKLMKISHFEVCGLYFKSFSINRVVCNKNWNFSA